MSRPDILSYVDLNRMALNTATLLLLMRLYLGLPITQVEATGDVAGLSSEVLTDHRPEPLESNEFSYREGEDVSVTGKGWNGPDIVWAGQTVQENSGGGIKLDGVACKWKGQKKVGKIFKKSVIEVKCYFNGKWIVLYVKPSQVRKLGQSRTDLELIYVNWQGKPISENELVTG